MADAAVGRISPRLWNGVNSIEYRVRDIFGEMEYLQNHDPFKLITDQEQTKKSLAALETENDVYFLGENGYVPSTERIGQTMDWGKRIHAQKYQISLNSVWA